MPRPEPHPLALFSLLPANERACEVIAHPNNNHLVSTLVDGRLCLDIGHICPMLGSPTTLATLGRNGDIFVGGSTMAKIQCSFEIDLNTGVVMFYDRSHNLTTEVSGEDAIPFEHGRPRKVLVDDGLNTLIGMGGERRNLIQFELKWHSSSMEASERLKNREGGDIQGNPRLARTIDEADTIPPSQRETRPHTARPMKFQMRYWKKGRLGSGQFGIVHKAVDVDTGKLMAVKILKRPETALESKKFIALKREVETLSRLSHPHIVDYIATQGWGGPEVEIFMGLKQGTLESLVKSGITIPVEPLGEAVFLQMLQAIDYLALNGIVHRDIKPENILYVLQSSQYHFQLGDFGFCNLASIATTFAGSPLFMAPEMFQKGPQTHKVDVWSLYVTILWTLNIEEFRQRSIDFRTVEDAQQAVLSIASAAIYLPNARGMGTLDPDERASAAQMLVKCYDGRGLTTPRDQVPPLSSFAMAGNMGLAPAAISLMQISG